MSSIKQIVTDRKLSQAHIADKMKVSQQCVSKWFSGKSIPNVSNMETLALVLGVPLDDLLACFYKKPDEVEL